MRKRSMLVLHRLQRQINKELIHENNTKHRPRRHPAAIQHLHHPDLCPPRRFDLDFRRRQHQWIHTRLHLPQTVAKHYLNTYQTLNAGLVQMAEQARHVSRSPQELRPSARPTRQAEVRSLHPAPFPIRCGALTHHISHAPRPHHAAQTKRCTKGGSYYSLPPSPTRKSRRATGRSASLLSPTP